ncbi:MAG: hypothetical protein JO345_10170 [Streptosporangiaceae bacterium]|nr:hypothetical protein [Streptosporangiaceae bacterium]
MLHRWLRSGALLSALGLIRLARAIRTRWWAPLTGVVLTVTGVMLRGVPTGTMLLIPGFLFLLSAAFLPAAPEADRVRRSRLERELAAYSTSCQRRDLEAILDRYSDGVTDELRDILARQAMSAGDKGIPGGGHC